MASTAIDTFGTTLAMDGVAIPQIQDIDGPALSTDTDEITNHSSPGGFEEFIATITQHIPDKHFQMVRYGACPELVEGDGIPIGAEEKERACPEPGRRGRPLGN